MKHKFNNVINQLNYIIKLEKFLEYDLYEYNYKLDISPSIITEYYNIILKDDF